MINRLLELIAERKVPIFIDERPSGSFRIMCQKSTYRYTIVRVTDDSFEVRCEPSDGLPPYSMYFAIAFLSAIDGRVLGDKPI